MPLAGRYGVMDQLSPFLSSVPESDRGLIAAIGAQNVFAQQNRQDNRDFMREMFAAQREASKEANEMGIRNQVIGSFLKDFPKATRDLAYAGNEYLPQQIQIAANSMQTGNAPYTPRNYYGFVG